jgi:hypothetical protein
LTSYAAPKVDSNNIDYGTGHYTVGINLLYVLPTLVQLVRIYCFDDTLQFMNVFSRPRPGKSSRRSLRPSGIAVYPSDRFEIRIGAARLIRNMRWTRSRSRALACNYGPANQGSGRPERARAGAGRPHEEHGALLRPIGRADAVRRIVAGAPLRQDRRCRANTNRSSCFPAARADSAQHTARTQAAPRLPTPRLIVGSRLFVGVLLRPRRIRNAESAR